MVVWEKGRLRKSDYRRFVIRGFEGPVVEGRSITSSTEDPSGWPENGVRVLPVYRQNDDFASMREVVARRYRRLQEEKKAMPGLVLIDGGVGQLHAAAEALESLGIINQ